MLTLILIGATLGASSGAAPMPGWKASTEELARAHAPIVIQQARAQGKNRTQDLPVAFDFDGDWDPGNNWRTQPEATRNAEPVVHYAAIASARRAYLTYYLFYPRDWQPLVCLPMVCHENDLEQFTLVVENDGTERGKLLLMDVKYHRGHRAYRVAGSAATPREPTDAHLWRTPLERVVVRVESGGHGVLGCDLDGDGARDESCRDPDGSFAFLLEPPDAGETLLLEGRVTRRAYALEPLADTLWRRRSAGRRPWGAPALAYAGTRVGRAGFPLGVTFAASGIGGGARAPWGTRPIEGAAAGDRFFDPAWSIAQRWEMPEGPDPLPYVEHPFLEDLRAECEGPACAAGPARRRASRPRGLR